MLDSGDTLVSKREDYLPLWSLPLQSYGNTQACMSTNSKRECVLDCHISNFTISLLDPLLIQGSSKSWSLGNHEVVMEWWR